MDLNGGELAGADLSGKDLSCKTNLDLLGIYPIAYSMEGASQPVTHRV